MKLPEDTVNKQSVDTETVVEFTKAINSKQDTTFSDIVIQLSSISEKEIEAAKTLVKSHDIRYSDHKRLLEKLLEDQSKKVQPTIRYLKDNGFIRIHTNSYSLTEKAHNELEWL